MDRLGDHFLARARFAQEQHRRAAVGDLADGREDFVHRVRVADDVFKAVAIANAVPNVEGACAWP